MSTCFSVGMRLAGGGGGDRAFQAARGLRLGGYVQRLYASSSATNQFSDVLRSMGVLGRAARYAVYRSHSALASHGHDVLFDRWVAAQLRPCALFHGHMLHALASLQRARRQGAIALLDRGMSHPRQYAAMLAEEYARWGVDRPTDALWLRRSVEEIDAADLLLVGSEAAARTHVEQGYPADRLLTIPYGVDTQRFRPGAGASARPFRVLFVGQLAVGKGLGYLLQAWEQLGWRDAELYLVGNMSPETRPALASLLELPGVCVAGYNRHPEEAYRAADIFCLPSLSEGSAMVTYEAMASGLPMVVTAETGALARDGCEALLVSARDATGLARALEQLREDRALRERLGAAARARAQVFTWEQYGRALVALYDRLLER
ncbi:MAG: glycosyltransferase family 4 protein [Chloroflexi bacterium]|nr:glycosyltransferase family 4 protein [Chloroflexota bacterium]